MRGCTGNTDIMCFGAFINLRLQLKEKKSFPGSSLWDFSENKAEELEKKLLEKY